ncbi:MAG TPA: hypothetical protein VN436_09505, partial [Holophaga sp.]|nr:hypothetical protein [Holophaga sp.]
MGSKPACCREIVAACGRPSPHVLRLRLADVRLDVRSNSPDVIAALAAHYRDFPGDGGLADLEIAVVDGPPPDFLLPFAVRAQAGDEAKEAFCDLPDGRVVRKRRTGLWLVFGQGGQAILGPCRAHVDQVINGLNARFMERILERGALLFHAAAVAVGEAGLAIAGFAGAGKSTLALE